jgi:hypothetical protein
MAAPHRWLLASALTWYAATPGGIEALIFWSEASVGELADDPGEPAVMGPGWRMIFARNPNYQYEIIGAPAWDEDADLEEQKRTVKLVLGVADGMLEAEHAGETS